MQVRIEIIAPRRRRNGIIDALLPLVTLFLKSYVNIYSLLLGLLRATTLRDQRGVTVAL